MFNAKEEMFFLFSFILDSIKPYELHQTSPYWSLNIDIYFVFSLTLDNQNILILSRKER